MRSLTGQAGAMILALVGAVAWPGCAPDDPIARQPIDGNVTLDSRRIASGTILFEPSAKDSQAMETGTVVGTTIRDGHFAVATAEGPAPGLYTVRIYAASPTQAPPRPGQSDASPRPMIEAIPERYNTRSTLSATVAKHQHNSYQFALQTVEADGVPARRPPR